MLVSNFQDLRPLLRSLNHVFFIDGILDLDILVHWDNLANLLCDLLILGLSELILPDLEHRLVRAKLANKLGSQARTLSFQALVVSDLNDNFENPVNQIEQFIHLSLDDLLPPGLLHDNLKHFH